METIYEIQRIRQVISEVEGGEPYIIRSPEDAAKVAVEIIGEDDREVFFVMCLNTKNRVVAVHRCHVGSINARIVHPREVFKSAILNNSAMQVIGKNSINQLNREDLVTFDKELSGFMGIRYGASRR
ncbi:JAB domain-containing protein [Pseudalkalibacillus sp. A8]|uniref:JAB domain-containing protein n=1 Tax=Pseudalkalibacillus sp. A8 TaxID=3382641 RepID=UPI0038B49F34